MAETLSLPSLLFVALILFLGARYLSSSSSARSSDGSRGGANRTRPVDLTKVDQVSQMFPQLDRRSIAWELTRNGGSVGGVVERVLAGNGLERPPPSFQPPNLNPPAAASSSSASSSSASRRAAAVKKQDLISRYNLQSRVGAEEAEASSAASSDSQPGKKATGWAATKTERAELLRKRREEMVLEARRKMQDRVRKEKEAEA